MFEKERFKNAIAEYEKNSDTDAIGTLNERMLHAVIKKCITDNEEELEVKIEGKNVADAKVGDTVYEIQSESLFPVKKKLDFYLNKTDLNVNIVFPVPREKYICWTDPESGEISGPNRSPKKRSLVDYTNTLIFITDYIDNPRMTLTALYISECEYRNLDGKRSRDRKRGSTRIERRPIELFGYEELKGRDAYIFLLPSEDVFTRKSYAKEKKLTSVRKCSYAIKMMEYLGMIRRDGKNGKEILYRVTEKYERTNAR